MKRMRLIMKTIKIELISLLALTLFSCSGVFTKQASMESTLSEDGKTYLVVRRASINTSREGQSTINPVITDAMKEDVIYNLENFKLTAVPDGYSDPQTLVTATDYDDLMGKKIPIVAGKWKNIKLSADLNLGTNQNAYRITYFETKYVNTTVVIKPGELNFIDFALKTSSNGGLAITMKFTGDADRVVVTTQSKTKSNLSYNDSKTKTFTASNFTDEGGKKSFVYTLSRTDMYEYLSTDTYYLLYKFYKNGITEPLNTTAYLVNVEAGFVTEAVLEVDLNSYYTIEYKYFIDGVEQTVANGELPAGVTITDDGEIPGSVYSSKKTSGQLPDLELDGHTFAGWYELGNYSDYCNNIQAGSSGKKILCAFFFSPNTVFVSSSGGIDDDGSSFDQPAASITKALETISGEAQSGQSGDDWKIVILGTVYNMDGTNDPWVIDNTYLSASIGSLEIYGVSGLDANNMPRDSLDGCYNNSSMGTTLTIDIAVPVTIRNLRITGGCTDNCDGAGLSVINDSEVYLEEGTIISGNETVNGAGAGIAVRGSAIVTMRGGSIEDNISDYDADGCVGGGGVLLYGTNPQFIMNGGSIRNNEAGGFGGGVCIQGGTFTLNEDAVIGGTSAADANKSTDGINGSGGGVYLGSGSFIMNGGSISYNESNIDTGNAGGGIYVVGSGSIFTMKGGTISDNTAEANGKGVYVSSSAQFNMGGNACIDVDSDNDIYLDSSAVITIVEAFDKKYDQDNPAAIITPKNYSEREVLEAGTGINIADEYDVFVVTPQVTGESPNQKTVIWQVNEEGKLYKELSPIESFVSSITSLTTSQTITAPEIEITADDLVAIADALNELATNRPAVEVTLDLKNLTGVTSVSSYTYSEVGRYDLFDGNTNLVEITLPSSLNDLNALFYGCSKLKTINIPGTITNELDTGFCTGCKALEKITLWNSTTEAFEESGSFNGYRIEKRAIYTGNILCIYYGKAFEQAPEFAEGITTIYGNAFNSCSMTSVEIPDTVTLMESEVFYNCKKLSSVVLSSGLSNIQASTFYNCTSLSSVTIPSTVTTINAYAFANCTALTTVNYLGTEEYKNEHLTIQNDSGLPSTGWVYQTSVPTGFVSVPGNGSNVPNMLVGKNLITQAEYEQYMVYHADVVDGSTYKPSTASEEKATTPVSYITFVDAVIYCNRRSEAEGLNSVYKIGERDNLSACTAEISDWLESTYNLDVEVVGEGPDAKYCFAWDGTKETDYYNSWDSIYDYGHLYTDEAANGYRLATWDEIEYIAEWNDENESVINGYSTTFREWLDGYAQNNHETRILTEDITKKIETQDYSYLPLSAHEETDYNGHCGGGSSFTNDMSFRVVRNAN